VWDSRVNRYYYLYREDESISRWLYYSQPFKIDGRAQAFVVIITRTEVRVFVSSRQNTFTGILQMPPDLLNQALTQLPSSILALRKGTSRIQSEAKVSG
jgi:hypothetical protein